MIQPANRGIYRRTPLLDVSTPVASRFWGRVAKSDGCWLWIGANRGNGYGAVKVSGKVMSAHCVSYVLHFGQIPHGFVVCHQCDNRACVRPDHLFAARPIDNIRDMDRKGRRKSARGEAIGSAKLTETDVKEIVMLRRQGMTLRCLAEKFSVHRTCIDKIVYGSGWRHVTEQL